MSVVARFFVFGESSTLESESRARGLMIATKMGSTGCCVWLLVQLLALFRVTRLSQVLDAVGVVVALPLRFFSSLGVVVVLRRGLLGAGRCSVVSRETNGG